MIQGVLSVIRCGCNDGCNDRALFTCVRCGASANEHYVGIHSWFVQPFLLSKSDDTKREFTYCLACGEALATALALEGGS